MSNAEWRKEAVAVRLTPTEKAALDWAKAQDGKSNSQRAHEMMRAGSLDTLVEKFLFATNANSQSQNAS